MPKINPNKTVFISYRRDGGSYIARSVFQSLRERGWNCFFDIVSINAGKFGEIILNEISERENFILVIAPGTMERCNEPNDWLRREIEEALKHERNIVPILFDNVAFKDIESYFTGELTHLKEYNSLNIYNHYFEEAMDKLSTQFLKISKPSNNKTMNDAIRFAAFGALGVRQFNQGNIQNAIEYWTKAIQIEPKYAFVYNNRGVAYYLEQNYVAAVQDFNQAIKLEPTALRYTSRGVLQFIFEKYDDAFNDYIAAYKIDPTNLMTIAGLAVTHHIVGNIDEAKRLWNRLLQKDADYLDADWVAKELNWAPPLVEEARKLIEKL